MPRDSEKSSNLFEAVAARRPMKLLIGIGILSVVSVIVVTALIIVELRATEIAAAKSQLLTLNTTLAEQTERALQSGDLILKSLGDEIKAQGIETSDQLVQRKSSPETTQLLAARIAGVPQLSGLGYADATGNLVNTTRGLPADIDISQRDSFLWARDNTEDRAFLTAPSRNPMTGLWAAYLVRRLEGSSGAFIGVAITAVRLDYFQDLYERLQITKGSSIGLWRNDGVLLARYPPLPGIGETFALQTIAAARTQGSANIFDVPLALDGVARLVATRGLYNYPVVVSITRKTDEILSEWRHTASVIAAAGAMCALAAGLLLWAVARQFRAYEMVVLLQTQREEAERGRRSAEAQLNHLQKMEIVGQLSGGIAHDFNNILTVVIGNLDEVLRETSITSRAGRAMRSALNAAERAATLTQRLLAFSRRQSLEPKNVDLNRLVDGMREILRSTIGETIDIKMVLAEKLWLVHVDPNQLESAVLNLVLNARDAMPGGGHVTIETTNVALDDAYAETYDDVRAGDYAMVTVSDTGSGMDDKVLARAFEPFFTTKEVGKGTGLGLSQVYGFIKQSGGHAKIDSRPGRGTTVRLYLPRSRGSEMAEESGSQINTWSPAPKHEAILLVEDDRDVRAHIAEALRSLGYPVFEAGDGLTALQLLDREQEVGLLMTDLDLPAGFDGRELCEAAKQRYPRLKVLFTTGYATGAIMRDGKLDPGIDLLRKPFTHSELAKKIRMVLGRGVRERLRPSV